MQHATVPLTQPSSARLQPEPGVGSNMYTVQFQRIARSCQRSAIGQETQSGEGSRLQAPVLTCSTSQTYPTVRRPQH